MTIMNIFIIASTIDLMIKMSNLQKYEDALSENPLTIVLCLYSFLVSYNLIY